MGSEQGCLHSNPDSACEPRGLGVPVCGVGVTGSPAHSGGGSGRWGTHSTCGAGGATRATLVSAPCLWQLCPRRVGPVCPESPR